MLKTERLTKNFHQTFRPERTHLTALLRFAAKGGCGTDQQIGEETGIPTGVSSGKVPVTLDYAGAMGLITLKSDQRDKQKSPELTEFGRVLLLEDPYMKTEISQWLIHLHLCGRRGGADTWYHLFCKATDSLHSKFTLSEIEQFFERQYGPSKTRYLSPMLNCYVEDSSLKVCGALQREGVNFTRKKAPIVEEMIIPYGVWLLLLLMNWFPGQEQVSVDELEATTGWAATAFWGYEESLEIIDRIAERGLIAVDRHMKPWLITASQESSLVWTKIYDDLI